MESERLSRSGTYLARVCRFKPQENAYLNGEGGPAQALLRAFLDAVGSAAPPAVVYLQGPTSLRDPLDCASIDGERRSASDSASAVSWLRLDRRRCRVRYRWWKKAW